MAQHFLLFIVRYDGARIFFKYSNLIKIPNLETVKIRTKSLDYINFVPHGFIFYYKIAILHTNQKGEWKAR
jgi:hypothetical protein